MAHFLRIGSMKIIPVMDKKIILLPLLLLFQFVTAQQVIFSEAQFDNGLTYPIAQFKGNPGAVKMLNNNILGIISEYEEQDYCIGQYGYVQQTNFIQLNFYFNCIDMDESKNVFHLFNLSEGQPCPVSEMFIEKEKKRYEPYFRKRIAAHYTENGKETPTEAEMKSLSIDDYTVILMDKGIEISMKSDGNWPDKRLLIYWSELRPYLKMTFL